MRIYGGLQPEDWRRWGQFTTFKDNAATLLARQLRPGMAIYCSPLVDPYQPAEATRALMPAILQSLAAGPPVIFTIQTRGPLILRDLRLLSPLPIRVSFSITTNRDDIRRLYEPHCAPIEQRWQTIRQLRAAGIAVHATLAPLLPCDPAELLDRAIAETGQPVICDPFHLRSVKPHGATTRDQAFRIAAHHRHDEWFQPGFQTAILDQLHQRAARVNRTFAAGPAGFALLSQPVPRS